MPKNILCSATMTTCLWFIAPTAAHAEDTLASFTNKGAISGTVRSYYFNQLYGAVGINNKSAYSLGGMLTAKTETIDGFRIGVSFFTASSLGTHGDNLKSVDSSLMGKNPSINALGQAYIQYQLPNRVLLRVGNQIINTPWMSARDSRMLPQTFQGVFAEVLPIHGLKLEGMRIFRWKSRTSDNYYQDNFYYASEYYDDPTYGVKQVLPPDAEASQGTLAFGIHYKNFGVNLQSWYYNFYQFAHMFYGSAAYTLKTDTKFSPFIAAQYMREWQGNSIFQKYNAKLFDHSGSVNATLWGGKIGVHIPNGNIFVAYNALTPHKDAFGGGAIVSPYGNYTAMYASFMTMNLVAFGPGHAWRIGATYWAWQKQIRLMGGYSRFDTNYDGKTNGVYLDLTYFPHIFKGLSIRDRVAIDNGLKNYENNSFIYNRLMLQYNF